ncbi:MAG: gamma-glutamyltransferase [Clostridia bacterium]|nr:gamma-glutamyltransferase [Clostridia bacterium]
MEKKKNGKNKGLIAFVCIALALVIGYAGVTYLPKLFHKDEGEEQQQAAITPIPTDPSVTADPSASPGVVPTATPDPGTTVAIVGKNVVSCSNPYAAAIGMKVLENGGNAVDAAIAVAFALGVLEPYASGIGGGGCMLVYDPTTDSSTFFDYRDAAGADLSGIYGKTGVPGFVLGMETAHKKFGSMNWGDLLTPAIDYAKNGFPISASFARHLYSSRSKLTSTQTPQYYKGASLLQEGDMVYQTELADTYTKIQLYGSSVFYHGAIGQDIISALNYKLNTDDFNNYTVWDNEEPVVGYYKGYKVVSAPAPFAGVTLIQMLALAEKADLKPYDEDLMRYAKVMASISSVTLKDRLKNVCDPRYHEVPTDLVSEAHINELYNKVLNDVPEYVDPDEEHESTTHIAVIDSNGMMVSSTNTLSDFFGMGTYVDGFFLNNTMVTSSSDPGARNYCVRGQRPRSFAMPTFIFGEEGFKMALGSSGGDRIPQVVMPIILRYFNGETLQEACDRPRLVLNGYMYYIEDEGMIDPSGQLPANGYGKLSFSTREYFGAFNAVGVMPDGTSFGAADNRRNGSIETGE